MKVSELFEMYVQTRDEKAELEAAHKEALKPVTAKIGKIEATLLEVMNKTGMDSIKTAFGTAYKSTRTSATVADKEAFWDFVVANNEYGLVDKRVSKTAVEQYLEQHESLPAGINWRSEMTINFRRATADIESVQTENT
jgi:hypothetical protein